MGRGARPPLQCLGDKYHDEDCLHTITLLAQHMVEPILDFFQQKRTN
jgi:hypothetical protein